MNRTNNEIRTAIRDAADWLANRNVDLETERDNLRAEHSDYLRDQFVIPPDASPVEWLQQMVRTAESAMNDQQRMRREIEALRKDRDTLKGRCSEITAKCARLANSHTTLSGERDQLKKEIESIDQLRRDPGHAEAAVIRAEWGKP